jgi:hypothetical protein
LCLREEQIGIACLDLKYSVCLSHDAIERGREEEERRLAAEEQARELFGYALTSETKTETCKWMRWMHDLTSVRATETNLFYIINNVLYLKLYEWDFN